MIILGKFGSFYGIKGWIKLFSYTENHDNIFLYKNIFILDQLNKKYYIKFYKYIYKKKFYITRINIVNDIVKNTSFNLVNKNILIQYKDIIIYKKPKEYYWYDIIKCTITNVDNKHLGVVTNIITTGIHDILEVKQYNHQKKIYIPFIMQQIIKKIDLFKKIIIVHW
ncbi:ribosome maturation factor RimM [Enterobacteriaceae endosymbiont of Macroplea appendiculata]|uniref:ribosome maturation factor RimM n=1 Tax=Enterobacteriaceae endosymbiont of Macroplea appendiculata TaxID=2675790 RepID=UPI001448E267|nr:ribosome maturation factor RimM [Enterobacteriaceae endosymbiont of Macroplea appendiculata]QJC30994.1 16S rRNA processing protein RimM [Enterobacteriaceae endosymbiont of Macroplea appendiculata]